MDKRPKGRLPRLTDGFHLQDIGNAAKSAASLDKLRKFLESQKLIKCSHKAWVPAHKASVPRAQSSSLGCTKLGLGRAQSRFPRVLHLGGDIVLHELTRSRSYIVGWWVPTGTQGCIVGTCGTMEPNFEALLLSPTGPILSCPAQYTLTLSTKCSPMASFIKYKMAPWITILLP